ncbi:MAG: DUF3800 domain-containing protein [Candidatus Thiodiazotropha taylori]
MDVFFADDSKQKGVRDGMGKIVSVGGLFLDESKLRPISDAVDEIAKAFGIPDGEEIKWSPSKESWIYSNLQGEDSKECYTQILQAALSFEARAIVIAWDSGRTTLKGERALEKCLQVLFERIEVHLGKQDKYGLIVADRPGGGKKQEDEMLTKFLEKVQKGTDYVIPRNVLLNILTTPSHLIRHLQVADLITGITTAMVAGQYKYAKPIFPTVKTMLIKNYIGASGGAGLKVFPNDLINLYKWLLQEDTFWKVGKNTGFSLPEKGYPYASNEFNLNENS